MKYIIITQDNKILGQPIQYTNKNNLDDIISSNVNCTVIVGTKEDLMLSSVDLRENYFGIELLFDNTSDIIIEG